jgi:hypothetical protein
LISVKTLEIFQFSILEKLCKKTIYFYTTALKEFLALKESLALKEFISGKVWKTWVFHST